MKKSIRTTILIVVAIVLCLSSMSVLATEYNTGYSSKSIIASAEFKEIFETITSDPLITNSGIGTTDFVEAYKLYSMSATDFSAVSTGKTDIDKVLSEDYVWIVTTKSNNIIRVVLSEGKWKVAGYKSPATENSATEIIRMEQVNKATADVVDKSSLTTETVKFFEVIEYRTSFAYFSTADNKYVVPFSARPDLTGLNNGETYSLSTADSVLSKNIQIEEKTDIDKEVYGGFSGLGADQKSDFLFLFISIVTLLTMLLTITIVIIRKRKTA